jgi:hypothetical protein
MDTGEFTMIDEYMMENVVQWIETKLDKLVVPEGHVPVVKVTINIEREDD